MKTNRLCVLLTASTTCICFLVGPSLHAQQHTRRGAALGGVTGALAGAAIGNKNDETAAGALIGGAVGLITGAAIGNSIDEEQARTQAIQQHQLRQYSRAVSAADVITMTRSGLSDAVIINHIRENGVQRRPQVSDVIGLHQQGVSEVVITAMQQAPIVGLTPPPVRPVYRRPPVVVEEHHYVSPHVHYHPRPRPVYRVHRHYHHPHRPRSSFHWGVRIGN